MNIKNITIKKNRKTQTYELYDENEKHPINNKKYFYGKSLIQNSYVVMFAQNIIEVYNKQGELIKEVKTPINSKNDISYIITYKKVLIEIELSKMRYVFIWLEKKKHFIFDEITETIISSKKPFKIFFNLFTSSSIYYANKEKIIFKSDAINTVTYVNKLDSLLIYYFDNHQPLNCLLNVENGTFLLPPISTKTLEVVYDSYSPSLFEVNINKHKYVTITINSLLGSRSFKEAVIKKIFNHRG